MKAIVYRKYGSPNVLQMEQLAKPAPKENEVLVKVCATSVTSGDQKARSLVMPKGFGMIGRLVFGVLSPRRKVLGTEFAGTIVAKGPKVTRFDLGDDIFAYPGAAFGGYADFAVIAENKAIALKPLSLTSNEAVALSFGGATALNFLRDKGGIQPGDRVLIVGASGGVGTAAIQLAKHFGAHVSGVCSTANVELVRSLGADTVLDYKHEDFTKQDKSYDIILDTTGTISYRSAQNVLRKEGRFLMVSGDLPQLLSMMFARKSDGKKGIAGYAPERAEDLSFIARLVDAGHYKPVIDRCYSIEQIQQAHSYVDTGRKKGNVVVSINHQT